MYGLLRRLSRSEPEVEPRIQQKILVKPALLLPIARSPERLVTPDRQRSYEEVAQALGFAPVELLCNQLISFFTDHGIKLYDYTEVQAWLLKKAKEADKTTWCWRPLRPKDKPEFNWGGPGFYDYRESCCSPYDRLVPQPALEKVMLIEKHFPDKAVKFFVSDYATPRPDPFIMVRPAAFDQLSHTQTDFIFDMWDEPGFGA